MSSLKKMPDELLHAKRNTQFAAIIYFDRALNAILINHHLND